MSFIKDFIIYRIWSQGRKVEDEIWYFCSAEKNVTKIENHVFLSPFLLHAIKERRVLYVKITDCTS